ncbi:MAG: GNAT family N-acetyltransferase, partial [Armatimonadota bacterium]|nr:GNAT family N-acetyltransferase [Armatimonadota bacterium]
GLTALEREWQELAAACPTATVFQTWEWNAAWWGRFGRVPGRRLRLVIFRASDGALVGLAPLMTSFWYGTALRRLSFVGTGASDYLDALAAPGWEDAVAHALYAHLQHTGGWQVADFQQLRVGSLLRERRPSLGTGLACLDVSGEPCPYLALPGDWDSLLRGLGKKTRANVNYYDRALGKVYVVEAAPISDEAELDGEMTRLFELHQRRWNQRWLPGVFSGRRVQAFHREAARALLRQGWLRLFALRLDGVTQASLYCFAYGDRLCYYQGGFEPTLAKLSLGTVLTARAMQSAIGEGRAVFDFLRGDEPYKAKWTGASHANLRRLVTRQGTPFEALMRRAQGWEEQAERRAKAWMRRKK